MVMPIPIAIITMYLYISSPLYPINTNPGIKKIGTCISIKNSGINHGNLLA